LLKVDESFRFRDDGAGGEAKGAGGEAKGVGGGAQK
jgi:hypothetical protein